MREIWIPVSGALAQQHQVEVLANNVANANTPGFKRDNGVFKEYLSVLEKGSDNNDIPDGEWNQEDFYRSQGAEHAFVKNDGDYTDFGQGRISPTGNVLDIALRGQGLFEILTPNGIRYSRKGNFTISPEGSLVTDNGDKVLSKIPLDFLNEKKSNPVLSPEKGTISIPQGKISINLDGEISVGEKVVGTISIVEFVDPHALSKEGGTFFVNSDNKNISTNQVTTKSYQGFLEDSNVNIVSEMSNLIKAHRHFDSIQRAIKAYDNIAGKEANEITKF